MLINLPIGLVNVWVARAQCKSARWQGSGQRGFLVQTKADNGLAKLQRQHPHCSMKEIGRMLTKKQTDAFHKTMGENEKGSRKIKVKERAPKLLIFGSKSTRPRDLLHFEI